MINASNHSTNKYFKLKSSSSISLDQHDTATEIIEKLKDLLIETDSNDLTSLKKFIIQHKYLLKEIDLNQEKIDSATDLELYTIIAREVCSPSNTEKYPDLDYCFNLAKDAVDTLGGDPYQLLEEHYQ